jgi:hypothetical protein
MDLMVVRGKEMPLYMHVVNRVLREMRIEQQNDGSTFNYAAFKRRMEAEDLTAAQSSPFRRRLDTLESFMPRPTLAYPALGKNQEPAHYKPRGNDWTPRVRDPTLPGFSFKLLES